MTVMILWLSSTSDLLPRIRDEAKPIRCMNNSNAFEARHNTSEF